VGDRAQRRHRVDLRHRLLGQHARRGHRRCRRQHGARRRRPGRRHDPHRAVDTPDLTVVFWAWNLDDIIVPNAAGPSPVLWNIAVNSAFNQYMKWEE
jgi:hypothetical protein